MSNRQSWSDHFMEMAHLVAKRSKDPSTQVGCVIINPYNNRVMSMGYNGFPRGVKDDPVHLNDRAQKYPRIIHAEVNAVLNCEHGVAEGFAYVTHPPCAQCMGMMIQAGIRAVFYPTPDEKFMERFQESFDISIDMAKQAGVSLCEIVTENEDE